MSGIFKAVFSVFDSIFGMGDEKPAPAPAAAAAAPPAPAPVVTAPTPMPLPDDAAVAAAKRRSIAGQMQRSGRQSTILTSDPVTGDPLG